MKAFCRQCFDDYINVSVADNYASWENIGGGGAV